MTFAVVGIQILKRRKNIAGKFIFILSSRKEILNRNRYSCQYGDRKNIQKEKKNSFDE